MVKCNDCGLKGDMFDREKFMQHGYPKDGTIRLSCMQCKSHNLKNTFWENFFFILGNIIMFVLCSWIIIPAYIYVRFMKDDDYE